MDETETRGSAGNSRHNTNPRPGHTCLGVGLTSLSCRRPCGFLCLRPSPAPLTTSTIAPLRDREWVCDVCHREGISGSCSNRISLLTKRPSQHLHNRGHCRCALCPPPPPAWLSEVRSLFTLCPCPRCFELRATKKPCSPQNNHLMVISPRNVLEEGF